MLEDYTGKTLRYDENTLIYIFFSLLFRYILTQKFTKLFTKHSKQSF